jgi:hypothetical protein
VEQLHAKLLFQLGYRSGERGLRYGGPNRCLGETPGLCDRDEVSDLVELHYINLVYPNYKNKRFHLCIVKKYMSARRRSADRQSKKIAYAAKRAALPTLPLKCRGRGKPGSRRLNAFGVKQDDRHFYDCPDNNEL